MHLIETYNTELDKNSNYKELIKHIKSSSRKGKLFVLDKLILINDEGEIIYEYTRL